MKKILSIKTTYFKKIPVYNLGKITQPKEHSLDKKISNILKLGKKETENCIEVLSTNLITWKLYLELGVVYVLLKFIQRDYISDFFTKGSLINDKQIRTEGNHLFCVGYSDSKETTEEHIFTLRIDTETPQKTTSKRKKDVRKKTSEVCYVKKSECLRGKEVMEIINKLQDILGTETNWILADASHFSPNEGVDIPLKLFKHLLGKQSFYEENGYRLCKRARAIHRDKIVVPQNAELYRNAIEYLKSREIKEIYKTKKTNPLIPNLSVTKLLNFLEKETKKGNKLAWEIIEFILKDLIGSKAIQTKTITSLLDFAIQIADNAILYEKTLEPKPKSKKDSNKRSIEEYNITNQTLDQVIKKVKINPN